MQIMWPLPADYQCRHSTKKCKFFYVTYCKYILYKSVMCLYCELLICTSYTLHNYSLVYCLALLNALVAVSLSLCILFF